MGNYVIQTYQSEKIRKDSDILLEVRDSDTGDDDICLRVEDKIRNLPNRADKLQLTITSIWRDHYEDDGDL